VKEDSSKIISNSKAVVESTSDDSESTDEGVAEYGSCAKLVRLIDAKEESTKLFELDSRGGLNGAHCMWSFPCLFDEESKKFFVMLGDITIDKFTKSTFMNLVDFCEKLNATQMILVQNRDHVQKEEFRKLITVLDGHRVGKTGMTEMLTKERLNEWIMRFALYSIDLN